MSLPEDNGELCARPSLDHGPAPPLFMVSPASDSDSFFDIYSFWRKILYINITTDNRVLLRYRGVSIQKISWVEGSRSEYKMRIEKILKTSKRNRREMTSIMLSSFFLILFLICSAVLFKKVEELCGGLLTIDNMHLKTPILNNSLSQS